MESILKNSAYRHQILLFVNDGSDGTLEWVRRNGYEYIYSQENVGICWALNSLRALVRTDYILYLNDDMYVCPDWDKYLWEEIQSRPDNKFFISSTLIQPRPFYCKGVLAPYNYGTDPSSFNEQKLLAEYFSLPQEDWMGATWPPNVIHRDLWDLVGGYSVEFSPGMYSDPDFSAKLWLAGVRYFKGVSKSRVYHFEQTSQKKVVRKNNGNAQFLLKYGITSSTFMKYILRQGSDFCDSGPVLGSSFRFNLWRSKLKSLISVLKNRMTETLWRI